MSTRKLLVIGLVVMIASVASASMIGFFYRQTTTVNVGHFLKCDGLPWEETIGDNIYIDTNQTLYHNYTFNLLSLHGYEYNFSVLPDIEGITIDYYKNGERCDSLIYLEKGIEALVAMNISVNPLMIGGEYELILTVS